MSKKQINKSVALKKPKTMIEKNTDWYDKVIERPIRPIVELLRNNGWNTVCSCGCVGGMYVEGENVIDDRLFKLHNLLYNYFCEKKIKPNYEITFTLNVNNGNIEESSFHVNLNKRDLISRKRVKMERLLKESNDAKTF